MLRAARLLIATDSGLMHVALAVGTPVLALFGPTDPAVLVRGTALLTSMTNGRDCQGCWNHVRGPLEPGICPLKIDCCMESLAVDPVCARALELLAGA